MAGWLRSGGITAESIEAGSLLRDEGSHHLEWVRLPVDDWVDRPDLEAR